MARKHLLADLGAPKLPAGNSDAQPADVAAKVASQALTRVPASGTRSPIGAVTRSLEQLKAQAVLDLSPDLIDPSPIADRLPGTERDHATLVASIREHGQLVPILVRPHPENEGRYQIAYGRRRLRALAELGSPVRSVVKTLTDDQMIVAQGMENTARADLSYIERALFAASLEEGGYKRDTIMAALTVDKTGLSRLISSASRIPKPLIVAIGPAPRAGRDRWLELAERLAVGGATSRAEALVQERSFLERTSDERFAALFDLISPPRDRMHKAEVVSRKDGGKLARVRRDGKSTTLVFDRDLGDDFTTHVIERLPEMHATFSRRKQR